ncbi:MAG: putative methylase [Nocardioidaceae bacterium]|jgi:putative DNA methylase|nr:putative methylase [Nocardioidaceae bacterium]
MDSRATGETAQVRRKLIEVSLPLEAINVEAAREKSIRHGHPSTLHLWWARRPLAAARAVLFAQLVDDPSSYEDRYRNEASSRGLAGEEAEEWASRAVVTERERLHAMLRELVKWENTTNERLLDDARAEIMRSTDGSPPAILDPFAGGGTIPLEAQRLGLEAHASDLNPVAVLINKALIEIPPTFAGRPPVFPGAADARMGEWPRATGMAEDVRRYGAWMRDRAQERIGHLYPSATLPDGTEATVIAWIWARTVTCPNPACGISLPLVRSWWLGKKKGKESYVVPIVVDGQVRFSIGHDPHKAPAPDKDGTVARTGATCISCQAAVDLAYIRVEGRRGRMGHDLLATVADAQRRRVYLPPQAVQRDAAEVVRPSRVPSEPLGHDPRAITAPNYGMDEFADLFTNRQLIALTTFSDLVGEVRELVRKHAVDSGLDDGDPLESGGSGAFGYADAVTTYLGMTVSKLLARCNTMCTWETGMDRLRGSFQRQAIPMTWDFAEAHPLQATGGGFEAVLASEAEVLDALTARPPIGIVDQASAAQRSLAFVIATDPPYYDNIGYADLSDFFYVWLRRSLGEVYPKLLSTLLVPKIEELVANPYRHEGKIGAREFFENGFAEVFSTARATASLDFPISVFYAFKQAETQGGDSASTGWETLLDGMIRSGWTITATWPMRSEMASRTRSIDSNALASSIVLALRPRPNDAPIIDRRGFVAMLKTELPDRLRDLQQGNIAPVDLPQAAIGPGMAVYSRYSRVVEPDGLPLSVREALRLINSVLAEVLSEQEGDFEPATRWCVKWFETQGFAPGDYGVAEVLASAYAVSVRGLETSGLVTSGGGVVQLLAPESLPAGYDPRSDDRISSWEVMAHLGRALRTTGLDEAARIYGGAVERGVDLDAVRALAYLGFGLAEKRKDSGSAQLFNDLVTSWTDIALASGRTPVEPLQLGFDTD